MRTIATTQPRTLVCGAGAADQCALDLARRSASRVLFITGPKTRSLAQPIAAALQSNGIHVSFFSDIASEPTIAVFNGALNVAREFSPDAVVGLGGGSALDVAKLVAAMLSETRNVREVFGIDQLHRRDIHLVCLPTTSGTGSEVSPNSILLDEDAQLKKGVISPLLVPDATYVDPHLMISMPAMITAGTGMDALTHCIEAYANKFAHPAIDVYALSGIRLIHNSLIPAIREPDNLEPREKMAYGSLFGGLCLGPVNTAAVHALSYPLGGRFHVPHGISNTLLLPHVLEFNLPAAPDRYAEIAIALGVTLRATPIETAQAGVAALRALAREAGIPMRLSDWNVPESAIEEMARSAMEVTRLLKNNVRQVTYEDAVAIYRSAFQ